jgi:hypothetical protein
VSPGPIYYTVQIQYDFSFYIKFLCEDMPILLDIDNQWNYLIFLLSLHGNDLLYNLQKT